MWWSSATAAPASPAEPVHARAIDTRTPSPISAPSGNASVPTSSKLVARISARPILFCSCSLKPGAWPGVHNLLPLPLRRRGLQPVGRLDQDTTGLLLMTDDGPLLHKLTSPKHHVPKVYEVTCKHPVTQAMCDKLLKGVVLDDDPAPVAAHAAERVLPEGAAPDADTLHLRLTLLQGKYHQVKRMVAAVGNRVEGLHRSQIGRLTLPDDLAPGQWRWLDDVALVLP